MEPRFFRRFLDQGLSTGHADVTENGELLAGFMGNVGTDNWTYRIGAAATSSGGKLDQMVQGTDWKNNQ